MTNHHTPDLTTADFTIAAAAVALLVMLDEKNKAAVLDSIAHVEEWAYQWEAPDVTDRKAIEHVVSKAVGLTP